MKGMLESRSMPFAGFGSVWRARLDRVGRGPASSESHSFALLKIRRPAHLSIPESGDKPLFLLKII
jgi:hypothetical protein